MTFIHSGSETRIYRVSSARWIVAVASQLYDSVTLQKKYCNIFDNDAENFIQITDTDIYNGFPKIAVCFWVLQWQHALSYLTGATLDDDVIDKFNFQFQRSGFY